jgi:hypothetical protein
LRDNCSHETGASRSHPDHVQHRAPDRLALLDCRSTPANSIACRVVRFTTMAGTGVRTVLSSLPGAFTRVRVSCAMGAHDLFACHV